jgi:hypothetical protein
MLRRISNNYTDVRDFAVNGICLQCAQIKVVYNLLRFRFIRDFPSWQNTNVQLHGRIQTSLILTSTDVWICNVATGVLVEKWFAFFAVMTHCVVLTVVTNTTTHSASSLVYSWVKVTPWRMAVTLTLCDNKKSVVNNTKTVECLTNGNQGALLSTHKQLQHVWWIVKGRVTYFILQIMNRDFPRRFSEAYL